MGPDGILRKLADVERPLPKLSSKSHGDSEMFLMTGRKQTLLLSTRAGRSIYGTTGKSVSAWFLGRQ